MPPSRRPSGRRISKALIREAAQRQRDREKHIDAIHDAIEAAAAAGDAEALQEARSQLVYGPFPASGSRDILYRDRIVDPCECGASRIVHAGKTNTGGYDATSCGKYRPDIVEGLIAEAFAALDNGFAEDLRLDEQHDPPRQKTDGWSVRPTDVGGCGRAVYYRNLERMAAMHGGVHARTWAEFQRMPEDKRAARLGIMIHDAWQERQKRLYPWREHEIPVSVPGLDSGGRPDDYDPITGRLRQCKTAGQYRWEMTERDGVAEDWLDTEAIYALVLERDHGYFISDIAFTVIERADGTDVTFVFDWDDAMRRRAKRALARLIGLRTLLENGKVPARDRSGPTTDRICGNCFARGHCWNIPAAEKLGRTPESLAILGPEPGEDEIEAVILDIVAIGKQASEAEGLAKTARAYVGGIPIGQYGVTKIRPGNRPARNYKAMYEDLLAEYQRQVGAEPGLPDRFNRPSSPVAALLPAATRQKIERARAERPDPTVPSVEGVGS